MLPAFYRKLAFLVCLAMLISLVACGGDSENVSTEAESESNTTDSVTVGESETDSADEIESNIDSESDTESEPGFSVEDLGNSARVTTLNGLTYTAEGYDSIENDSFSFVKGLTINIDDSLAEKFNRFTMSYYATAPIRILVTYHTGGGKSVESEFYLEAGEGEFSGLTETYLEGKVSQNLTQIVVDTCKGESARFVLYSITTEKAKVYPSTCFIQNEKFKLGIDLGWGGTVNYVEDLSKSIDGLTNLVNKHDTGRLIQQSYYGTGAIEGIFEWGSFRESDKWPYNPVQGGDRGNVASRLVDVEVGENYIYIKSQPMDWGKVNYCTPSYMENKYILEDDYIRIDNRFMDFSGWEHPYSGQELPALYTVSYLDTFFWYGGKAPWTGDAISSKADLHFWGDAKYIGECMFPIYECNTETWCAWVNTDENFGLGLYVPNVDRLKAGRYEYNGSKDADNNATSYVAPYNTMKIVSFEALEYSYLLATGTIEEIRSVFIENKDFATNETLHKNYVSTRLPDLSVDMSDIDFTVEANCGVFTSPNNATATYDANENAAKLTVEGGDPYLHLNFVISEKECLAENYERVDIVYMVPTTNSASANYSRLFTCTGEQANATASMSIGGGLVADGQYHTVSYNVGSYAFWTGKINQLRLDFFENAEKGDVMYVKSVKLIKKAGIDTPSVTVEGTLFDFGKAENIAIITSPRNTDITYDSAEKATKLFVTDSNDVHISVPFVALSEPAKAEDYPVLKIEYMIPTTNGQSNYECDLYLCAGDVTAPKGGQFVRVKLIADGEYHTLDVDLSEKSYWKGTVNLIRIDYFDNCSTGDVFYLKSVELAQ